MQPSGQPTLEPTMYPTSQPSGQPSAQPSSQPSCQPTRQPTGQPTGQPSRQPTGQPSRQPSSKPSRQPTSQPSRQPTGQPTGQPTMQPTTIPTSQPSIPTGQPSSMPSVQPSSQPSAQPSCQPSGKPSMQPSSQPSSRPSCQPSGKPSTQPSSQPTSVPSSIPTIEPKLQVVTNTAYSVASAFFVVFLFVMFTDITQFSVSSSLKVVQKKYKENWNTHHDKSTIKYLNFDGDVELGGEISVNLNSLKSLLTSTLPPIYSQISLTKRFIREFITHHQWLSLLFKFNPNYTRLARYIYWVTKLSIILLLCCLVVDFSYPNKINCDLHMNIESCESYSTLYDYSTNNCYWDQYSGTCKALFPTYTSSPISIIMIVCIVLFLGYPVLVFLDWSNKKIFAHDKETNNGTTSKDSMILRKSLGYVKTFLFRNGKVAPAKNEPEFKSPRKTYNTRFSIDATSAVDRKTSLMAMKFKQVGGEIMEMTAFSQLVCKYISILDKKERDEILKQEIFTQNIFNTEYITNLRKNSVIIPETKPKGNDKWTEVGINLGVASNIVKSKFMLNKVLPQNENKTSEDNGIDDGSTFEYNENQDFSIESVKRGVIKCLTSVRKVAKFEEFNFNNKHSDAEKSKYLIYLFMLDLLNFNASNILRGKYERENGYNAVITTLFIKILYTVVCLVISAASVVYVGYYWNKFLIGPQEYNEKQILLLTVFMCWIIFDVLLLQPLFVFIVHIVQPFIIVNDINSATKVFHKTVNNKLIKERTRYNKYFNAADDAQYENINMTVDNIDLRNSTNAPVTNEVNKNITRRGAVITPNASTVLGARQNRNVTISTGGSPIQRTGGREISFDITPYAFVANHMAKKYPNFASSGVILYYQSLNCKYFSLEKANSSTSSSIDYSASKLSDKSKVWKLGSQLFYKYISLPTLLQDYILHNTIMFSSTIVMIFFILMYQIHVSFCILVAVICLAMCIRMYVKWIKTLRNVDFVDLPSDSSESISSNIHNLVDPAISKDIISRVIPKTYNKYHEEYENSIPKYLPRLVFDTEPSGGKLRLKSLIKKHKPKIKELSCKNYNDKADGLLAHALHTIDKDSTKGMRNIFQAVLTKIDAGDEKQAQELFKKLRPTAAIEKKLQQLGVKRLDSDTRFSILNVSPLTKASYATNTVTHDQHLRNWNEITNKLDSGDAIGASNTLDSMRTLVHPEYKTPFSSDIKDLETKQSLYKNFTIGSSSTFSRPRSISSNNSVMDIPYDSDDDQKVLNVSIDMPDNTETSPVQIRTPQSAERSVLEIKPATYDLLFRLAQPATPITPEVNQTFSSYSEQHSHFKMVAKLKEQKKNENLLEKQSMETNYQAMLKDAMKRFK
jgi:hypothetical protein